MFHPVHGLGLPVFGLFPNQPEKNSAGPEVGWSCTVPNGLGSTPGRLGLAS